MVRARYVPEAGHIIKIDFDSSQGHEQGGWRPAIVLSPSSYNSKTRLVVAAPVTNQIKGYPFEVRLPAGMKTTGVILADALKNLDWYARNARYIETVPVEIIQAVHERLVALLGIATR